MSFELGVFSCEFLVVSFEWGRLGRGGMACGRCVPVSELRFFFCFVVFYWIFLRIFAFSIVCRRLMEVGG